MKRYRSIQPAVVAFAALSLCACERVSNTQTAASAAPRPVQTASAPPPVAVQPPAPVTAAATPPPAPMIAVATLPGSPTASGAAASQDPRARVIEQAALSGGAPAAPTPAAQAPSASDAGVPVVDAGPAQPTGQALLIRAEVLLDRAHFSPGVIDGRPGSNLRRALGAYQQAHSLSVTGQLDAATWQALASADSAPVTQDYVITQGDVAGPFVATPTQMQDMARLDHLAYATPREELAERFHMDERLLAALNPNADFASAGTRIIVVQPATTPLPQGVTRLEVDKSANQVRIYGEGDRLIAAFPATVGSTERPAPSGDVTIRAVAPNPTYTYDPSRLTFGHRQGGRLTIPSGPNNPVGSTWIDLSQDTYGIHGTPDPTQVGKTASHGCVRLTNWDAAALGHAVHAGMRVSFVGTETRS